MIRSLSRGEVENLLNMKLFDWQWERIAPSMRYDDKEPKMGTDELKRCPSCGQLCTINYYGIHICDGPPKKRRFWMSKDKKQKVSKDEPALDDPYAEQRNTFYQTNVNVETEAKQSPMLVLLKIIEPNTRSEAPPAVTTETIAVRADAIDLVEPATYASDYQFVQPVSTGNPRDSYFLSRNMYDAFMGRTYWMPQSTEPCVRVYIAGGPDYLVEGNVLELKDRIDFLEA